MFALALRYVNRTSTEMCTSYVLERTSYYIVYRHVVEVHHYLY